MSDLKSQTLEKAVAASESTDSVNSHRYGTGEAIAFGGRVEFYEPVAKYEGRHRYDPKMSWTDEEEKRLVRRLDCRICAWVGLMFFALQLDRGNITQALADNMLKDLGLSTNDFNRGMTIFYLCFLFAELPSQLVSKRLGPDVWIPIQMVAWSVVACSQSRLTGRKTFYLTRSLLGLIEGGFIPDAVLYLTYFYKSRELPNRLSFFWGALICTNIVSAFLAYGILHMRGLSNWAGWRWLFVLEGGLTAIIGILSWFYLPPSPCQTASRFRGKDGWFTEREEKILVNRILRDDPSKGDMHNRQGLTLSLLWNALLDYDLWPIYLLGLTWPLPAQPTSLYITLNLRALGFSTFQTTLLTIPAYVLWLAQLIFWTWLSERLRGNKRFFIVLVAQIWFFPLVLALELLSGKASPWIWYSVTVLLVGYPYVHAILVAITSRNAGSVRTRTVGTAMYNVSLQAMAMISSNIYNARDAPLYRTGNKVLLCLIAWNIAMIISIRYYYKWRNSRRDKVWESLTREERDNYLSTTKDQGNKRLDFRFAY